MSAWMDRLADVDDDYLIGLSNKGIVKRAYKDKGEVAARIGETGDNVSVEIGGETVTVCYPLGESRCTCPSRSMCRHIVQAILVLKEHCAQEETAGTAQEQEAAAGSVQAQEAAADSAQAQETAAGSVREQEAAAGSAQEQETAAGSVQNQKTAAGSVQNQKVAAGSAREQEAAADFVQRQETGLGEEPEEGTRETGIGEIPGEETLKTGAGKSPGEGTLKTGIGEQGTKQAQDSGMKKSRVWEEICAYPFPKLKKTLGTRGFQTFANQATAGIRPGIRSASVVTVNLPEQGFVVKLLSPLEYSTCTCHRKELCVHKAAAILWCQMEAGTLAKESLQGELAEVQNYDMEGVREAAGQMRAFMEELFATGLSRTSPDILDYLERLAIVSHNLGLARFEGYFRALSDSYDRYFARKAAFRTEDLMAQMARLYRRVEGLAQARDAGAVAELAGEFRASYLPVGNLDLIGIAMEHFQSQTGYEGETIYFLEENTRKWYTYTNARPVFYDSRTRRGYREKAPSPWGLNLAMEDLLKVRIHLTGARCDDRNRLSSSQDTRGEVTGEQKLCVSDVQNWYYRDFGELFSGQIWKQQRGWLSEQSPSQGGSAFSQGGSAFSQGGGSQAGEESGEGTKGTELVFVQPAACGKSEFSQTGQMLTLPLYDGVGREILVEVAYSKQESGTIRYLERISQKKVPCFLGKVFLRNGRVRMYPVDLPEIGDSSGETEETREAEVSDTGEEKLPTAREEDGLARRSKFEVVEDLAAEVMSLMEDLCQSGFDTVHDSTLKDIRKAAECTEQYGMAWLSQMLASLAGEIEAGRHRMERKTTAMAVLYTDISEYLYFCRQKSAYDRGRDYYEG